jgi:hypothetical protein
MRAIVNLIIFLLLVYCASCNGNKRESQMMLYFHKMGWHYPIHVLNEDVVKYSNNIYEDEPIMYDTSRLQRLEDSFSKQIMSYFKSRLPIDTTVGYLIQNPMIYNDVPDSLVYSIEVKKFKSNTRQRIMPCEGCESIENNTIFISGNRAVFRIKTHSVLEFKNWME